MDLDKLSSVMSNMYNIMFLLITNTLLIKKPTKQEIGVDLVSECFLRYQTMPTLHSANRKNTSEIFNAQLFCSKRAKKIIHDHKELRLLRNVQNYLKFAELMLTTLDFMPDCAELYLSFSSTQAIICFYS